MTSQQSYQLLFAIALILALAHIFGLAVRRLGQPTVIGEILLGILLGPTLLPAFSAHLIPVDIRPGLSALADIGVAIFMFLVGLDVDHQMLRAGSRRAAGTAVGAMLLPLALGCLLATGLWGGEDHGGSPSHVGFVVFFGLAMSMTAFPVLARILAEDGMRETEVAGIALTAAAIGDLSVWSLLALVLALTDHQSSWHLLLLIPYAAMMILAVRPALAWALRRSARDRAPLSALIAVFVLALASGGATEWLGLHFIFGAFLAGVVFPRTGAGVLREQMMEQAAVTGTALFMPVYFVLAGLNVNLRTVGWSGLGVLGLILATAICGKLIGGFVGARASRLPVNQSAALGILMNTRGLTELIILGVGLQLHYLDERLYSLMVAMAVMTTMMTGPLLQAVYPTRLRTRVTAAAAGPSRATLAAAEAEA